MYCSLSCSCVWLCHSSSANVCVFGVPVYIVFSKAYEIHPLIYCVEFRNRWAIGMTGIKTIQSEIETIFTNWCIHWPVTLDHSIIYNLGRLVLQCFAGKNHKC